MQLDGLTDKDIDIFFNPNIEKNDIKSETQSLSINSRNDESTTNIVLKNARLPCELIPNPPFLPFGVNLVGVDTASGIKTNTEKKKVSDLPLGFYIVNQSSNHIKIGTFIYIGNVKDLKEKLTAIPVVEIDLESFEENNLKNFNETIIYKKFHSVNPKRMTELHKPNNFDEAVSKMIAGRELREKRKAEQAKSEFRNADELSRLSMLKLKKGVTKPVAFNFHTTQRETSKSITYRPATLPSEYDKLPQFAQSANKNEAVNKSLLKSRLCF
jgi:hypothetical protein